MLSRLAKDLWNLKRLNSWEVPAAFLLIPVSLKVVSTPGIEAKLKWDFKKSRWRLEWACTFSWYLQQWHGRQDSCCVEESNEKKERLIWTMVGRRFFTVERVRQNRVVHNVVAKIQRTNAGRSQASCISPEHTLRELVPQIGPYLCPAPPPNSNGISWICLALILYTRVLRTWSSLETHHTHFLGCFTDLRGIYQSNQIDK